MREHIANLFHGAQTSNILLLRSFNSILQYYKN